MELQSLRDLSRFAHLPKYAFSAYGYVKRTINVRVYTEKYCNVRLDYAHTNSWYRQVLRVEPQFLVVAAPLVVPPEPPHLFCCVAVHVRLVILVVPCDVVVREQKVEQGELKYARDASRASPPAFSAALASRTIDP